MGVRGNADSYDWVDVYARLAVALGKAKEPMITTDPALKKALPKPLREGMKPHQVIPNAGRILAALGIAKVTKANAARVWFEAGPRLADARRVLQDAQEAGVLRPPWGMYSNVREEYLRSVREYAGVNVVTRRQEREEKEALDALNGEPKKPKKVPASALVPLTEGRNGDSPLADFLVNGQLPPGCVVMRRDEIWILGRPADLRRVTRGED